MRNLIEFLTTKYHWLLFVLLEAASVALLFSHNNYQGSVWLSSANAVSGKCFELTSKVTSYFGLQNINRQLTEKNTALEQQLNTARAELAQLKKDTMLLKAEIPATYKSITARVVQNSINKHDNLLTIDKGTADGIKKDMAVVSGNGAVGIVYIAGLHYSVVLPIINSRSNISCSIRNRGYFGYLNWPGQDSQHAYVEDVPRHAHYHNGDIVETSGYSSVFPAGITVGRILTTYNSPDGLSYRIKIKLATDFANLHDVCVIDNTLMREKLDILHAAQDSLQTNRN